MGVLEPWYPRHMLVEGENVPHFISSQNESSLPGKSIRSIVMQIFNGIQSKNVKSLSSRNITTSKRDLKMTVIMMGLQKFLQTPATIRHSKGGPQIAAQHVQQAHARLLKPEDSVALGHIAQPLNS